MRLIDKYAPNNEVRLINRSWPGKENVLQRRLTSRPADDEGCLTHIMCNRSSHDWPLDIMLDTIRAQSAILGSNT